MDMKKAALLSNIALPQIIFATAVKDFPNGTFIDADIGTGYAKIQI